MTDQGYPSKRHRGNQPRQKKRSPVRPQRASTSSQAAAPIIPHTYSQFMGLPGVWESYQPEAMEYQRDESEKFSSVSSPATSYLYASTPSGDFAGTGGYVIVQNPSSGAYSNGSSSNQTSEESEHGQQAFYSPPLDGWIPGAECPVERVDLQAFQLPATEQELDLLHLGSPRPRPVYDPYQEAASNSEYKYTELENYTYQASTTESSPPPKTDRSSPPWNSLDHRVPRYNPSFIAFEPEVGPAGTPAAQKNLASPPRKSKPKDKKPSSRSSKSKLEPRPGRNDKAPSPVWENIVVRNGGLATVSENVHEEGNHGGGGRRKGALAGTAKEKAARIRKIKACWSCWLLKVPCSEGEVCDRCLKYCSKKSFSSASNDQLCSRQGFNDFEPAFFPDFLHLHLSKLAIKALMDEHMKDFKDGSFDVYVTSGSVFTPMKVEVHFFTPKGWESELLKHHHLTTESEEQKSQIILRYSAPVGLMSLSTSEQKKALKQHIEDMLENPYYVAQTTAGDISDVPAQILDVAVKYYKATDSSLVRNALTLHAIHYYMSRLLTFTPPCAAAVYASCQNLSVPQEPYLSSRLLNRQLKFVMHRIHQDLTRAVLSDLEKSMRSRTKDTWGASFCAILVLCLCMEGLQTAADMFVVCDLKKEGAASGLRREHSLQACEAVENWPFQRLVGLFHEIYRSSRTASRDGGFNPLRTLVEGKGTEVDDVATQDMVREIGSLVYSEHEILGELSQRDTILGRGRDADELDPQNIKINNTGRLAAKFLMSFFGKES